MLTNEQERMVADSGNSLSYTLPLHIAYTANLADG